MTENAGVDGAVVAGKLLESTESNWGFGARTNEYAGIHCVERRPVSSWSSAPATIPSEPAHVEASQA
jgi:hypothetical protein